MTKEDFVKLFIQEAKNNSAVFTTQGNIECQNGKNISIDKLERIFDLTGKNCMNSTAEELTSCGIESCCFITFRDISKIVLNTKDI